MKKEKITSYDIYSRVAENKKIKNNLDTLFAPLPQQKYSVIYADPPWDYGGKLQFDKSSKQENLNKDSKIFISSANFKYPTVKTKDLKSLDVNSIAEDDSILFMWTTNPHLSQAIELGQSWGFEYKTVAFVWNKKVHNPGQYTLSYCELCLLFKKGRIPRPRGARNVKQLVEVKRGKHSEKPKEVREGIEKMFPEQSKIELFAREAPEGWDVWGLDSEKMEHFFKEK